MKIITCANRKGGVGKSSLSTALAGILTEKGFRTLIIDCDQQCNTTDTFRAKTEGVATIYDILLEDERISIPEAVQHTENGDILAGDPLMREADEKLKNCVDGLYRMADAFENLDGYDYVIIDTAPAMNSVLHNCLIASDEVIIPVTADRYALQGLSQLYDTINAVKRRQNPRLNISGLLLTRYNGRANLSKEVRESLSLLAEKMGTKVFEATIRECVKVKEAQAQKMTVNRYAPNCTAMSDYTEFVNEFLGV